jgi:CheY-like chemotaxis protein
MIGRTLGERISVETRLAEDLWRTYADANQLESTLLNLVVNARDAMRGAGRLTIETGNAELREDEVAGIAPGSYVTIAVGDTGCGIPDELLGKVFEPFFTTKDTGQGSGLGLSMVYGFVRQSGGHVRIASEVGAGTTVKLFLPRLAGEASGAAPPYTPRRSEPTPAIPRARPGETILMVEDNAEVRAYGATALRELGYRVIELADAQAALRVLEEAGTERFDLLFSDVVLPGGIGGHVLARHAIERAIPIPVLLTTGYADEAVGREAGGGRRVEFLAKPFGIAELAAKVRELIDASADRPNREPERAAPAEWKTPQSAAAMPTGER